MIPIARPATTSGTPAMVKYAIPIGNPQMLTQIASHASTSSTTTQNTAVLEGSVHPLAEGVAFAVTSVGVECRRT
jgi:hypothetical protein